MAVTGINTNNIGRMQQYIEDYARAIDAKNITAAAKNVCFAIKGNTRVGQVKALCQACDSRANTLTNKLRAYKNRLIEVQGAYTKQDQVSATVNNVANAIKNLKS